MRRIALIAWLPLFCLSCADEAPSLRGSGKHVGFNIFLWNTRNQFIPAPFASEMVRLKSMGATLVLLCPYWFTADGTSSAIAPGAETVSDADLSNACVIARTNGLNVGFKPHVDCLDWTARFRWDPADKALTRAQYLPFVSNYAWVAQAAGATYFVVGTELDNLVASDGFFEAAIDAVRAVFSGHVTYASSFNQFADVSFWDRCDSLGVNAWFHVSDAKTPARDELLRAWQKWNELLGSFAAYYGKDVFLTEVGYINEDYCGVNPGLWDDMAARNDAAQEACLRAAAWNFATQPRWTGFAVWNWELNLGAASGVDYTPGNKAAEDALREEWTR